MIDTLEYIYDRWQIDRKTPSPIEVGRSREGALPFLINRLGFQVGAEVGVERGFFSKLICLSCPNFKLYSVDAWENYDEYGDYIGLDLPEIYKHAKERLTPLKNCQMVKGYSMDVVKRFADESLDFVYIDANHGYKNVSEDIREWSRKVRKGGIIAGHDYNPPTPHTIWKVKKLKLRKYFEDVYAVKRAVDDWIKEENISPLFVLTKIHCRSWFVVKTWNTPTKITPEKKFLPV